MVPGIRKNYIIPGITYHIKDRTFLEYILLFLEKKEIFYLFFCMDKDCETLFGIWHQKFYILCRLWKQIHHHQFLKVK